ncbi:hypothetical protein [Actinoplanes sp. NPDC049316]|uniref:hypothetical protein n=1 Tax=Actinoplanes sp. NPDC049316 TaxID=3154727 RepID=UPI003415DCDF
MSRAAAAAVPAICAVVVCTVAALMARSEGLPTVAVMLLLSGVLIAAYAVRHRAREERIYRRTRK